MRIREIMLWVLVTVFVFSFSLLFKSSALAGFLDSTIDLEVEDLEWDPVYSRQCVPRIYYRIEVDTTRNVSPYWNREICENRIPILAVYKNGTLVEQIDLRSLTLDSCDEMFRELPNCSSQLKPCYRYSDRHYHSSLPAALNPGEYATFRVVMDPRNVVREGRFRVDGTQIADYESNNEKTFRLGCNDIKLTVNNCPSSMVWPGSEITVNTVVENYYIENYYTGPGGTYRAFNPQKRRIIVWAKLSKDKYNRIREPYLDYEVLDFAFAEKKLVTLKGKIPSNIKPGNYYLIIKAELYRGISDANPDNNKAYCLLRIQSTAQHLSKEMTPERRIPFKPGMQKVERIIEAASFDFVLREVLITPKCKLTVKIANKGKPLKDEDYVRNAIFLTIKDRSTLKLWNFTLSQVDPRKELKTRGEVTFIWPTRGQASFTPGSQVTVTLNPQRSFIESNGANNSATLRWICRQSGKEPNSAKPKTFLKIH